MRKSKSGFTIVELLIVIVVIGILAAITIVAYNGVQQRAQDATRKSDIAAIAKSLQIYNVDNGNYMYTGSNCGNSGNGTGWFNLDYDGTTTTLKSVAQCLVDSNTLSKEVKDPSGTVSCGVGTVCHAYIKQTCPGGTYLYASLESEPTMVDGPANGSCVPSYDTAYGMNYIVKVN